MGNTVKEPVTMHRTSRLSFAAVIAIAIGIAVACGVASRAQAQAATAPAAPAQEITLKQRMEKLDRELFDAFNRCELDKLASYFDPALEFYHDNGGVTWSRDQFISDVKNNVCGKFTRKLLPATLEVWPVGNWGAMYTGTHHFCQTASGKCEGSGRFLHIWQNKGGEWRVTRVVSYDHRALAN